MFKTANTILPMNSKKLISLDETSRYCYKLLSIGTSMDDVLNSVSQYLTNGFGNYLSPGKLRFFDEMRINFIELLDQIIYEYRENVNYDPSIKDYIISDLYSRLSLNLEAFNEPVLYKKNLRQRPLYPDDLIIIRDMKLNELIPFILEEWDEITNLHKPAIKTLLYFARNNFDSFKNIFSNTYSKYIKSAAVLGMIYDIDNSTCDLHSLQDKCNEYMWNFNFADLTQNQHPETPEQMVFSLLHIERTIENIQDDYSYIWILKLLSIMPDMEIKNSWLIEIYNTLSNIFINFNNDSLIKLINTEERIVNFIKFIDFLPRNIFNRITGKLDDLSKDFHFRINSTIEKGKVDITETDSNIFNYSCWNSIGKI